jgi:hypothetical protein
MRTSRDALVDERETEESATLNNRESLRHLRWYQAVYVSVARELDRPSIVVVNPAGRTTRRLVLRVSISLASM